MNEIPRRRGGQVVAQGRIDNGPPVGVIDIGSNSVRLVVYEGLTRSLTPIFNEKVLAGLGREVLSTGLLADDAVGPMESGDDAERRQLCFTPARQHIDRYTAGVFGAHDEG